MRILTLALACVPLSVWADVFPVHSVPEQVIVHPDAARISRSAEVTVPAGRHEIRLSNLPHAMIPELTDIQVNGAVIESRIFRKAPLPTAELLAGTPEAQAAKAVLDAAEEALSRHFDQVAQVRARGKAAKAQIDFLEGLKMDELSLDVEGIRALGQTIAADGTAAREAIVATEAEARQLQRARAALEHAVELAKDAYDKVANPVERPQELSLMIDAPNAGPITINLDYWVRSVGWAPVYRMNLSSAAGALEIERDVSINQFTGEPWINVDLTVTTIPASGQTIPIELVPRLLRSVDAEYLTKRGGASTMRAAPQLSLGFAPSEDSAPVIAEERTGTASFSGAGVVYTFETPVTVNVSEAARVALAPLDFDVNIVARAIPSRHQNAFRMIAFTNETGERVLGGQAVGFVDGQAIGAFQLETIEAGAEVETGFGPVHGLQLKRAVLNKQEGDRGLIARENAQEEDVRLSVENLTDQTWEVTLVDQVPYSEQEDLEISWQANPAATRENVEDARGILEWDLTLAPGASTDVRLQTSIRWPEGQVLQPR